MIRPDSYTPSPMERGSGINFAISPPLPSRHIVTPLSYERLLVRFHAAQISILEQYPDVSDSARVADIQFVLGGAVASAEAGIAGEIVVSPGNLKHLVVEKIRGIHKQYEALREGDDAEDEEEDVNGSEKSVNEYGSHNEESVEQHEARKTVGVPSTSIINVQALNAANLAYSRLIFSSPNNIQKNPNLMPRILPTTTPLPTPKCRRTLDPLNSPPEALASPKKRFHISPPEPYASIEFQPPVIPHINTNWTPKEIFYQGMQFATSFFLANHGSPEVANNEKDFHEYVCGELGLEMDYETGEAFEEVGIIGRGTLTGAEKEIKVEGGYP